MNWWNQIGIPNNIGTLNKTMSQKIHILGHLPKIWKLIWNTQMCKITYVLRPPVTTSVCLLSISRSKLYFDLFCVSDSQTESVKVFNQLWLFISYSQKFIFLNFCRNFILRPIGCHRFFHLILLLFFLLLFNCFFVSFSLGVSKISRQNCT